MEEFCSYLKENVNWILPLLITIIFSLINVKIACYNYKNSKEQQKLQNDVFCFQLYDKRLKVYESVKEILANIISNGEVKSEDESRYYYKIREVDFLFGEDIKLLCSEIGKKIIKLRAINKKTNYNIEHNISGEKHDKICEMERELLDDIVNYSLELTDAMHEYISFANYKVK